MPRDKVHHFIAGVVISGVISMAFTPVMGLVVGVLAGALKEVVDRYTDGATVDFMDFVATAGGAIAAAVLIQII